MTDLINYRSVSMENGLACKECTPPLVAISAIGRCTNCKQKIRSVTFTYCAKCSHDLKRCYYCGVDLSSKMNDMEIIPGQFGGIPDLEEHTKQLRARDKEKMGWQ
jgi:hypothetical protein